MFTAIIGAGIGGASASHHLTKLFEKNLDIDIFESNKVGGRLATVSFGEDEFESGGSVILPSNKYMKDFVKLLNLYPRPAPTVQKGQKVDFRFGIYNGKEFVVKQNSYQVATLFNLFMRYGLQPVQLVKYIGSFWKDFDKIYSLQNQGVGFENVTALLGALNQEYTDLLEVSIKDHLIKKGYGEKIIDEIVKAAILLTFGQDTDVHSFLASVSLANTDGSPLWSVNGGNKKVHIYFFFYILFEE